MLPTRTPGDERNELIRKILQVCSSCCHLKSRYPFECDRRKSLCHSKRVQKWLKELEAIGVAAPILDPRLQHNARERRALRQKYAGKDR